ncbi:hypothetical protein DQ04_01021060 [Trypanosoma grayi]|uniref:hypothetical protein n=1 Tax=Trypanosoma grayi TaxID=71804 RepID=UPI0004F3F0E9|nr:hypothetical protein DQ04_01021060 [Trypanosoma grayi]KEG13405.1 hypothetical protein DQ04_01021060 [Trypanosoma grayi]
MEAGTDSQVQWSNLLEAGDAATLFAIFRETVSSALPGSSETKSILQFMESHLYVAALKVDLEALCTTTSMGFLESVLNETRPSRLDPRECLTELLSATWLGDGYGVAVYLRLLQATFRQIFFDTLRRRKECTTVVERRLKARTTMRAWYGGVDSRVSQIILRLCKRDALPKMVQTVKRFQTDGCGSDDDEEQDDNSTDTLPLVEPTTLEALLQLVLDLSTVVGDSRRTVPLLLMVKAVTVAAQSYSDDDEFLHKNGNEWQKWAATLCRVGDMKTGTSTPTHDMEYSPALASRGNFRETGERATRALLDMIPACGLVAFLLECSDGRFGKDIMDSVAYEDNERGRDASSTKVLARIQALKKEEDELCVLSDGDWVSEEDEHYVGHFSLRMVGAMLLLCDLMMQDCCECRSLLSNSPSVLFFLLGPMLLESLKSSSLSVAMTGLALLAVVLPHVPPYSIHAYGELNEESTQAQGLEEDAPSLDSCSYHTRKFGLVFELVKSLMNISATCPSEAHRVVARAVFTLFLRRCAGDLRMVVYSSFLVVTPFASICSLMLHSLREEWNSCQSLCNPSEYRFLRRTLPRCLLRTQENWMKRLLTGETGFIDPLVQSLNFVRSLIAEDYRRQPKDALFQFASGDPRAQLRKETGKGESCDRWDTYLSRLMRDVVPQLRALVVAAEAAVSSSTVEEKGAKEPLGALRTATLSPLDCFALTMALEGLEGQVVCGG